MPRSRRLGRLPVVGSAVMAGISRPTLYGRGAATSGGRAELLVGGPQPSRESTPWDRRTLSAGARLDWFELLVLVALVAVSIYPVAVNLHLAHMSGMVWMGIDGEFPGDQMQYLAWIRDASHHVLVSDLFVPWPTPHDFLQPMVAISGGLAALGMAPWLALLLWKPVGLLAIFFAVRAYCRRMLAGRWERRAALALALFAAAWRMLADEWLPSLSWGYPFALVSIAALVAALLCYARARTEDRVSWLAPALGLLCSWLHPWEGQTLLLIVVGTELVGLRESLRRGLRRQLALPALMIAAVAVPLAYYVALDRFDPAWHGALVVALASIGNWPLHAVLLPLIPLLAAAAFAYLRRPQGVLATATYVWPFATLASSALNGSSAKGWSSLHSWSGITIPLAVLAVIGVRNAGFGRVPGHRWLGAAAVTALTIPATIHMLRDVDARFPSAHRVQTLLTTSESRAMRYLAADPRPGSVLSDYELGAQITAETGRRTYVAALEWAGPGRIYRANAVAQLLHNPWYWFAPPNPQYAYHTSQWRFSRMSGTSARAFVLSTGARFVYAACHSSSHLTAWLRPITRAVHRFGCITVYDVS